MTAEIFGLNVWTKNMPKTYLEDFSEFAHQQDVPIVAVVDDVLPEVVFGRSPEETEAYSSAYFSQLDSLGFDDVVFVSDMFPDRNEDLARIVGMGRRVGLSAFLRLLPETKTTQAEDLTLVEVIDACWQLEVLDNGLSVCGVTSYLTGKRSTALFRMAKDIIPDFDFRVIDED